jgi:hypothetical protein
MDNFVSEVRRRRSTEYLQLVDALSRELERAMQALIENSLPDFEESVANQQRLSVDIARSVEALSIPTGVDGEMLRQMRIAAVKLQQQSDCYAALVQHSSHAAALMVSLFRSFRGELQEASGSRLRFHTWSCQM